MLILVVVFSSCVRNKNGQETQSVISTNVKVFEVAEVVQATSYTYLKVNENNNERWVAVPKQEISIGDVYYYDSALEMNNFQSKDLDRTFDVIYFVNQISKTPLTQNKTGAMPPHSGKVETKKMSTVTLEKADGEVTIAQIFAKRTEYSSKEFEIRGVVVKINKGVMGKNWIHVQDGTNDADNFDLTITTQNLAEVNDEVIFKGKLTLNKDFGSGYSYEVIMEDAALVNKIEAKVEM